MLGWKSVVVPYPGLKERVFDRFVELFIRAGMPAGHALFSRADFSGAEPTLTYLVSPDAAEWVSRLSGGRWEDDPGAIEEHAWSLLAGNGDPQRTFGIRLRGDASSAA